MLNAKEAYNITKPTYDKLCERRLNFILRQIEAHAKQGEFSYIAGVIYPENEAELKKLGYSVTQEFSMARGRYTVINWRNV